MTLIDFAILAKETRDLQKAFFKENTRTNLANAKAAEHKRDSAIEEIIAKQPKQTKLF